MLPILLVLFLTKKKMNQIINQILNQTNLSQQQAWWLLEFITDRNRSQLQFLSQKLTSNQQEKLDIYINQIAVYHKPLAYILGWIPFLNLKLIIAPPTLIPRPETEYWIDELITSIKKSSIENLIILDILSIRIMILRKEFCNPSVGWLLRIHIFRLQFDLTGNLSSPPLAPVGIFLMEALFT